MKKQFRPTQTIAVLTFTILTLLGTGSVNAAPHAKNAVKNKTNHAQPASQGTWLFATGTVDPVTSTVKAITADNRFTWIRLPADALVIQGGKKTTTDAIGEGNKLLCQGKWVDDAWGPVFQASRIEIMGNIGDASLSQKVAAACQAIQGTSQSSAQQPDADNDMTAPATDSDARIDSTEDIEAKNADLKANTDELEAYNNAADPRRAVAAHYSDEVERLGDAAYRDPTLRHNPMALEAMQNAVTKYKNALDALDSLAPVPPVARTSEMYEHQGHQQGKVYADLRLQYFGLKSRHGLELMKQALEKAAVMYQAASVALAHDRDKLLLRDSITQN